MGRLLVNLSNLHGSKPWKIFGIAAAVIFGSLLIVGAIWVSKIVYQHVSSCTHHESPFALHKIVKLANPSVVKRQKRKAAEAKSVGHELTGYESPRSTLLPKNGYEP